MKGLKKLKMSRMKIEEKKIKMCAKTGKKMKKNAQMNNNI